MVLGGLGTVSSLVARWLALSAPPGRGTHLVLVGRSGRYTSTTDPQAPHEDRNHSAAFAIALARGDVACAEDARLHWCGGLCGGTRPSGLGPMSGVVHAGGVLRDATVLNQTAHSAREVFAPKLGVAHAAGWAADALPLQQLVAFSSVAGVLGPAGQANYAGANAGLDAWAQGRQARGTAGVSAQWGKKP